MSSQPPTPTPSPGSDISAYKTDLEQVYAKLMDRRSDVVQGFARATTQYPVTYRAEIMVDFLISGLMGHLHEFARNEARHVDELRDWGNRNFHDYANFFADEIITAFPKPTDSTSGATTEIQPQNPTGA